MYRTLSTLLEAGEAELSRFRDMGLGHLTIGVSTTLCRYRLLPYLKTFIAQYPHISINISCQSTNHTLDMLRDGSIDLGLVAKPEDTGHIFLCFTGKNRGCFRLYAKLSQQSSDAHTGLRPGSAQCRHTDAS